MTDARRRLRLVTEAAYAAKGSAAVAPVPDAGPARDLWAGGGPEDQPAPEPAGDGPAAVHSVTVGAGEHPDHDREPDWTLPRDLTRRDRWGTPVLLAARVGVVVLVLAVAATITIVATRPSAPEHQPDLAAPDPPADWAGAGPESQGQGDDQVPGDSLPGAPEPESAGADDGTGTSGHQVDTAVVVHVAGAVHAPGIVELPDAARVHEAISAAGGPTEDADLAALNMAAPVQDGHQVYVPEVGEEPRLNPPGGTTSPGNPPEGTAGDPGISTDGGSAVVDLNHATATDLQTLPGIGPAMSDRIITHREEHGPFSSVDDLLAVSGIGPATLDRLRDRVTV